MYVIQFCEQTRIEIKESITLYGAKRINTLIISLGISLKESIRVYMSLHNQHILITLTIYLDLF